MGSLTMLLLAFTSLLSLQLLVLGHHHQDETPHWVAVCGGTYLFPEDAKSWNDAGDTCELYGGHLLQIDSMTENYCLLDYAQSQDKDIGYWHSGNDIEREGVYRQADRELIIWKPLWGQWGGNINPDGGADENCLGVSLTGNNNAGKWFDQVCTNSYYYICEREE